MATVSIGTVLMAIDIALPSIALPSMARSLHLESSTAVQLMTVYQLILVMTLLPVAALGERLGYRTIYIGGITLFSIGGVLCYFAPTFQLLLLARGLQALGASATTSVTTAIIRSIFPDSHLGRALAAHSVVVSTANAFAPALGGLIVAWFDWRMVFIVGVPLAVIALLCSSVLPPSVRREIPFDWTAALLCAMAFGSVAGGLELLVHSPLTLISLLVLGLGAAVAFFFVRRELSQPEPILPLDLIRQRVIALSVTGSFLAFNAAMIITVTMPFRLAHEFGFTPGQIGTLMAPWPLMIMIASPIAAILSDRIEPALLGGFGMAASVVGVLTLFFLPAAPDWIDISWRMALSGIGFAFFTQPNARLILKSAPRHRTASAGGLTSTTRLTGQVLGSSLAAGLLAFGALGSQWAPLVAAAMCLVASVCSFARRSSPAAG
ncbi:MAG: MFS transporter [Sphingobium sp.]|nr:MFS transporter [Sphingobium sp.]MBP8670383.1 MFS transporter [Sphingobium sp.]MBP9157513.1 MFS transporter [Sphingobium sp.]